MTTPVMIPPLNFELVSPGVYRSGFPTKRNVPFLRRLGLRCIVRLCKESYSEEMCTFLHTGVRVVDCKTEGNKEPFKSIPQSTMRKALSVLACSANHPVLVHCSNGLQTTGCVIGCLRKAQGWALSATFDEYRRHAAGTKVRVLDLQCIELCDVQGLADLQDAGAEGHQAGATDAGEQRTDATLGELPAPATGSQHVASTARAPSEQGEEGQDASYLASMVATTIQLSDEAHLPAGVP